MEHQFKTTDAEAGGRLDVLLVKRIPGLSRRLAGKMIAEGAVRVDGRRARKGQTLRAEQTVAVSMRDGSDGILPDPGLQLPVIFEDASLVVVDKPAGVPTHPLRGDELGTAASALLSRYPEMAAVGVDERQPGVVHRLDNDTSGLLVAARTNPAFVALRRDLQAGRWDKRYQAVCVGRVEAGLVLNRPIGASGRASARVRVCLDPRDETRFRGQPAITEVLSVRPLESHSFVEVRVRRGRRHQVRAHLAAAGHPLVGDLRYGGPANPRITRHALHAHHLELTHPESGVTMHFRAPLPPDLTDLLDSLAAGA